MPKKKSSEETIHVSRTQPALSPEMRQAQLIALSMNVAEKQLREGTASAQVITHFLKLGTEKEKLEREKLENENKLLAAKTTAIESADDIKALYADAIAAMTKYKGDSDE